MTKPTTFLLILALAAVNAFPQPNNPTPGKGTPAAAAAPRTDPMDDPGVRKLSRRERKDRIAALEEKYRVFLKDVEPIMLPTELNSFLVLESNAQRDVYIEAFWIQRDSDPKTAYNEYRESYYERIVEAKEKFKYLTSDRSRTYLVKGKPDDVFKTDCTRYLQPIEVWHYFLLEGMGHHVYFLFYQPRLGGEFELWRSMGRADEDLKRLLSPENQQAGFQPRRISFECMHGDEILKGVFWMQSNKVDVVKLFDPPAISGEGVKKILDAAVLANPNAPKLNAEFSVRYPGKKGAKTSVEMTVILDRSQLSVKDIDGAKSYSINVTGELLKDEKMFENFRYRFDFPEAATGEKIPVTIERFLRPADYKPRIKLVDVSSGAEALVESSITVPEIQDSAEQTARKEQSESALTLLQDQGRRGESRLRIAPLPDELLSGLQHIETIVTGEAIKAVEFYLDNRKVMVKRAPPYTLDLDFGSVPQMRKIKAVALDASGSIVTGDEIVVNTGGDAFRVRIAHPRVMNKVSGKVRVEIDAHVPEGKTLERIELYLNELKLATLFDPPFVQTIDVPATAGVGYLKAVAALTDPEITPIEDVVFINTPAYLEQIEVHLIELPTTVLRGGRTVTGLEQSAFRVLDEGKPVPISRFDYVTNLPLSVGMALDTSESMRPRILEAQKAAAQFFKNVLEGGDRGFLVSFSSQPQLVQKWTPKLSDLSAGVSSLRAEEATAIFDAIVFSLYNFQGVKGQKALVVLTDGKDTASRFNFDQSLEYARRAAVPIYIIGIGIKPTDIDARFKMGRFARETGGATYYIERAEELSKIYNDIQVELRSQYLLGFYPPDGVKSGSKWREVIVEVKDGRAKTIRGYYP